MSEFIKIICPDDGAILSIENKPGLEGKNVVCPLCRISRPFTQYRRYVPKTEDYTDYPAGKIPAKPCNAGSGNTELAMENQNLGKLTVVSTRQTFRLKPGRNVVGRKASASDADFQIETGEKRRMSRQHIVIEVEKVAGKGYVHQTRLFKDRCNDTYINNTRLEAGDCIVLHHGDRLQLPDADVIFEIPDSDITDF